MTLQARAVSTLQQDYVVRCERTQKESGKYGR